MPSPTEISRLASQLHDAKLVNMDASAREFVGTSVLQGLDPDAAAWYVIGGSHYAVVCGLTAPETEVVQPAVG